MRLEFRPCLITLASILAAVPGAMAARFDVNSTAIGDDAAAGDGACATAAGTCTMTAAIQEANALAGADTIVLGPGDFNVPAGAEPITSELVLQGAGPQTWLRGDYTVVRIRGNDPVTVQDLRVSSVWSDFSNPFATVDTSGADVTLRNCEIMGRWAGIQSSGSTVLDGCVITSNEATAITCRGGSLLCVRTTVSNNGGTLLRGIGAYLVKFLAPARLTLDTCSFRSNGGRYNDGIVVPAGSTLTATDSVFEDNSLYYSQSPITVSGGDVVLRRCTLQRNYQSAVLIRAGTLRVESCLLADNRSNVGGGTVFSSGGSTVIVNSTITNDMGADGVRVRSGASVELLSSTISDSFGAGIFVEPGGIARIGHALLAGNAAGDIVGTLDSLGWNLVQAAGAATLQGNLTGMQVNVNPLLGPLSDNGGPTDTQALLPGSPAIDAGDPAGCVDDAGAPLGSDQRGVARPADGDLDGVPTCDIGAFEADDDLGLDSDGDGIANGVDNCSDVANSGQQDRDGDLAGDACDCAPDDPGARFAPGESVLLVRKGPSPDDAVLSWSDNSGAGATHDVARDLISSLHARRQADPGCVARDVAGASFTDGTTPPPSDGLYWLVRPTNACGIGTWGSDSLGAPRPACP